MDTPSEYTVNDPKRNAGDTNSDAEDPPLSVIILLALFAGICFTLILAILWNRFCRRRRFLADTQYHPATREGHRCHHCLHPPQNYYHDPLYAYSRGIRERHENPTRENLAFVDNDAEIELCGQELSHRDGREADNAQRAQVKLTRILPSSPKGGNYFNSPLGELLEVSEKSSLKKLSNKLVVSIARKVTHVGDFLSLDNMGITLNVPPGAVKEGEEKLVMLVLDWDLDDIPEMSEDQSLVSPVVYVGPHGLHLEKPCILRYKHCAYDRRHIQVMRSETELTDQRHWQGMCDQQDDSGSCLLTADEVHLQINSFTLFTCVQNPILSFRIGKWLQLAAFSYPLKSHNNHHQVRVYFLNKTPCALQWAIQNEASFGGKLLCLEKSFLFYGNMEDMRVDLRYLSDKWERVDDDDNDCVDFLQIWHGKCPHVSICFRKKESYHSNKELNFSLYVYQETNDNEGKTIVVHVTEGSDENATGIEENKKSDKHSEDHSTVIVNFPLVRPDFQSTIQINRSRNESNSRVSIMASPEDCLCALESSLDSPSCVPHSLKVELRKRLDPESPMGNNWKAFLERIGHGDYIQYIQYLAENGKSPTELCIALAEQKGMDKDGIKKMFCEMGRLDVAKVIDDFKSVHEDNYVTSTTSDTSQLNRNLHPDSDLLSNRACSSQLRSLQMHQDWRSSMYFPVEKM